MRLAWFRPRQRLSAAERPDASMTEGVAGAPVRALKAAAIGSVIMYIFLTAKHALFPNLGNWSNRLTTSCFIALVVGGISYSVLRREERHRLEMASSEMRYRLLFWKSLTGAYRSTVDGRILDCNVTFCQMFGYASREEVIGRSAIMAYFSQADRVRFIARLEAEKELTNFEQRMRRKDGSVVWILTSASLVADELGEGLVIQGTVNDVTERKRSEETVLRAEEKYRAIFEDSVVGIFQGTPDGQLTSVNRAFAQMLGYDSPEEMLAENPGRASSTLVDPSRMGEWFQQLSEHGVVHGVEFEIYRKDRTTKWARGSLRAIRDASGDIVLHEGTVEDITERKQAEEMLQDSENKYRVLFEDSADATWLMDENGFVHCNSAALHMFGYSDEVLMLHPADISPAKQADGSCSRTKAGEKMAAAFLNGKERFEWLHQRKNGDVFPADVCLTALTLSGRKMLLATVRDITDRKQAEEALLFKTALLEAQTETTIDGILVVDRSDHILLANKQFGFSFGIPDELLSTRDDLIVLKYVMDQVEDPDTFVERVKYLNGNRDEKSRDEVTLKDGKIFDRYSAPLVDSKGQYRGRIWYFRDITDRKVAEERIQFLAYHDALTELPHRALLEDRLNNALASALRRHEKVALLFIDLDRLKIINDSFGHSFGDILLKDVAKRLKDCARQQDTVARVGGDEFLVLLSNIKDVADAAIAAERIMEAMKAGFTIQGHSLSLGCSIGISIFPEHGVDSEALIRNADAAMYSAKESGRSNVRFFTDEMNAQAVERLTMDKDLRLALDRKEFFLVYQPQMEIESGRITGLEALIRWRHPEMGLVPPGKFISIAENNGLILPIGEWVLRTACSQARSWQDEGLPAVPVAVNVSAVQFRQAGFCALIRTVLQETGLSPRYLELELTEGLLLSNEDVTLSLLRELKEMGVNLAIDDFGTGYSSLSYLRQFPVDKLKIDQSFIRDVAVNTNDAAIANAIISMAKSLHLKVIAEGVENEGQMSFLREHRCDEIQGYYLSRPISADDAALKLRFAPYHGAAPLLGIAASNSRAPLPC
jgi:diguanylate cyclase (GGDEF)-like protein/PAS domain S-box-containing protein